MQLTKAGRKGTSTKSEIRASKEHERRVAMSIFLVFILIAAAFSVYYVYKAINREQDGIQTFQPKAAIVDHLSLTFPNPSFVENASRLLNQSGYSVDYFSGEQVTVDFFRELPTRGYSMIILRVHSSSRGEWQGVPLVSLFTSELYSTYKYVNEQFTDQLAIVSYVRGEEPYYFGLLPNFTRLSMRGSFNNTIVIAMGCESLSNTEMARAWIEKGARIYVGWNSSVSASRTDQATFILLSHLVTEKQAINQALESTMKEIGPDNTYQSCLALYAG